MVQGSVDDIDVGDHTKVARGYRLVTVAATVALFGLHLWTTRNLTGPSVVFDESGYLGNARWLAGGARWDMPTSPGYAVGYPVLLAPFMTVFHTADAQWRAVMVVNASLLASMFPWLLHVFRRMLGAPRNLALLGAAVGALAPAAVAASGSAIAENLVLALVPAAVAATWAVTTTGRPRHRAAAYGFGPLLAVLVITHPRFTLVAPFGLLALAFGARRSIIDRSAAVGNGLLLVGLTAAGTVVDRVVRRARWSEIEMLQGGPGDWLDLVGHGEGLTELFLTAVGQLWYLAAGSLGLSMVGIWFLVDRTRASGVAGVATARTSLSDTEGLAQRDRRFSLGFLLGAAGIVFATSVFFFAQNQFRADHWIYGRHNDSFTPLWLGSGVIALARVPGLRRRLMWLAGSAVVVGVGGLVVWANRDPADMQNQFSIFAVPALSRVVAHDTATVFKSATVIALAALAVTAAFVVVVDRRPTTRRSVRVVGLLALPLALAPYFAWTGYGTVVGTTSFRDYLTSDWSTPSQLERLGVTTLEVEGRTARSLPTLLYPFALPGVDVTVYDARHSEPGGPYVVARVDAPERRAAGDRLVLVDNNLLYGSWDAPEGIGVWVRPGPDQDRLAAAGFLLPAGFPTVLPTEARSADLSVTDGLDPDGTLRIAAGSDAQVTVTGRHTGAGSPWPDVASADTGRVQLLVRVEPDDPDRPAGIGSGGELDQWVRPGDTFTSEVTIRAIGAMFAALPPGRYTVHLGVGQAGVEGPAWFAGMGPGASFPLVVT